MSDKKYKGGNYYYKNKEERFIFKKINCISLQVKPSGLYYWRVSYTSLNNDKRAQKYFRIKTEKDLYKTKREALKFLREQNKKLCEKYNWEYHKNWNIKKNEYSEPRTLVI